MGEKRCAVPDYPLPSGIIIYSVLKSHRQQTNKSR